MSDRRINAIALGAAWLYAPFVAAQARVEEQRNRLMSLGASQEVADAAVRGRCLDEVYEALALGATITDPETACRQAAHVVAAAEALRRFPAASDAWREEWTRFTEALERPSGAPSGTLTDDTPAL